MAIKRDDVEEGEALDALMALAMESTPIGTRGDDWRRRVPRSEWEAHEARLRDIAECSAAPLDGTPICREQSGSIAR